MANEQLDAQIEILFKSLYYDLKNLKEKFGVSDIEMGKLVGESLLTITTIMFSDGAENVLQHGINELRRIRKEYGSVEAYIGETDNEHDKP